MSIKCHVEIEGVIRAPGIPLNFRALPKIGDAIRLRGSTAGGALYRVSSVIQLHTGKGVRAGPARLRTALIQDSADGTGAGVSKIWTACRSRDDASARAGESPRRAIMKRAAQRGGATAPEALRGR